MQAHSGFEFVPVDGLALRCRLEGPEGAPWLLLSNSLMTDLTLWDAQVAAWGDRFRILRYDQRGHGGSGLTPAPVTLGRLVEDALALLDHFRIDRAVVAGVSMGAATALGLAGRHPGRVLGVLASDGQARTTPGGAASWQERIAFARDNGMRAVVEATVARWFRPGFVERNDADFQRALAMMSDTSLDGYVACATALTQYDFEAELGAIQVPVLLVAGAQDGAMPAAMRALRDRIPGAQFAEIAESGHLPNLERAAAFNAAAEAFLLQFVGPGQTRP